VSEWHGIFTSRRRRRRRRRRRQKTTKYLLPVPE
jgi:hypothetical protein